ncbi:MAG: hypothetical protein ABIO57_01000 [Candidatus Paceibacterota bacterium]
MDLILCRNYGMLSEDRTFQYRGVLTLRKSRVINAPDRPVDDVVNWLFLRAGDVQFSFVYKIERPDGAEYGIPFSAHVAFTATEHVQEILLLDKVYEVLRGEELIGKIVLAEKL